MRQERWPQLGALTAAFRSRCGACRPAVQVQTPAVWARQTRTDSCPGCHVTPGELRVKSFIMIVVRRKARVTVTSHQFN